MRRAFVLALREVRSFLQDRAELVFSLVLPIAIFALMYVALGGQSLFNGIAYVVNLDSDGVYSQRLVERLNEQEELEVSLLTLEETNVRLEGADILVCAIIPEDFSEKLSIGWPTQITFKQRGNGGTEGQIVAGMIRGEADRMSQELQAERQVRLAMADRGIGGDQIEKTVHELLRRQDEAPLITVTETTLGGEASLVHMFLPGIVSMFVLFAVTLGSRALVEERRKGTLERLLTTQLTVGELYLGKFLAGTLRGFVQTLILLTLAYAVFRLFSLVSFAMILVVALVFAAAASAFALIIASAARTDDQAVGISIFFTMATVMLGGTFFEIPKGSVLALIGKASINTFVNSAFKTMMLPGSTLADVAFEITVLLSVVVGGLIISRVLFRAIQGVS